MTAENLFHWENTSTVNRLEASGYRDKSAYGIPRHHPELSSEFLREQYRGAAEVTNEMQNPDVTSLRVWQDLNWNRQVSKNAPANLKGLVVCGTARVTTYSVPVYYRNGVFDSDATLHGKK